MGQRNQRTVTRPQCASNHGAHGIKSLAPHRNSCARCVSAPDLELLEPLPHHRDRRPIVLHAPLHEHERRPLHHFLIRRHQRLRHHDVHIPHARPRATRKSSRPPSPDAGAPSPTRPPSPSARSASPSSCRAVDRAAAPELLAHRLHRMSINAHAHGVIVQEALVGRGRSAPARGSVTVAGASGSTSPLARSPSHAACRRSGAHASNAPACANASTSPRFNVAALARRRRST